MVQKVTIKDNKAICRHCDTKMLMMKINKYHGSWPWVLIGLGALAFFFIHFGGPIIGLPMIILGIYLATSKQMISMCPECGYYFPVMVAKKDRTA